MRYLFCFIPPLAVLSCGKPGQFLVSVLLTLCFYIPGFIHALGVVNNYYADKRTDRIVRAIGKSAPGSGPRIGPVDKNATKDTVIGFLVIAAAIIGFSKLNTRFNSEKHGGRPNGASAQSSTVPPTRADKSAPVEQAKPALVVADKLPQYTIISEETEPAQRWRNVRVRLQEKVSEDDLKKISERIKSAKPKISSGLIWYYLPEQTMEHGSWAIAEFTPKEMFKFDPNPKLEIKFEGNPKGTQPPKLDGEIVGQWEWYSSREFFTLIRTKDGLKMITIDGKSGEPNKFSYLVTAKKEGERITIRNVKDRDMAYWILDKDKNLLWMDSEDNKPLDKLMATVKPTLKLGSGDDAKPAKDTATTAAFATADEAKREAIRRYPDLGVSGSAFNREFVARYKRYQQERPSFFNDTFWPMRLAEETSKSVGGGGGNSDGGATPASKTVK